MKNLNLKKAIDKIGGQSALARAVGVSPQLVQKWLITNLPPHWVLKVEAATGVSRKELRPDIYPD